MSYARSNNPSLKYQRATPFGRLDKGIRKFKFVTKHVLFIKIFLKKKYFKLLILLYQIVYVGNIKMSTP